MKYILLFAFLFFGEYALNAQYTWCVSMKGKTWLRHVEENRDGNRIWITEEELGQSGYFHINFNRYDTAMRRTIFVDDSTGSGIQNWEEVRRKWQIPISELKSLMDKGGELSFYFTEIPRDINKAMLIKVRPVHLCTVKRKKT